MPRWLAVLACALFLAGLPSLRAEEPALSATTLLRDAYLAVVRAELAQIAGQTEEAIASYRAALQLFDTLYAQYPGWQGELVSFRAADCQNRVLALQSETSRTGEGPAATNDVPVRVAGLSAELAQLREILGEATPPVSLLSERPDSTGGEASPAASGDEPVLRRMREENDTLRRENRTLARDKERLEGRLAKLERKAGLPPASDSGDVCSSVIQMEARRLLKEQSQDPAIQLLEQAVGLMPDDEELVLLLASAYCHGERYADAIPVLKGVVKRNPKRASAWLLLGTADMGLGKLGDARVAMERAVEEDPKSAEANFNMAQILMALNPPDPVLADRYYGRAIELGCVRDAQFEESIRRVYLMQRVHAPKKR